MEQKIFTKQMAEAIADKYFGSGGDEDIEPYEIAVPGGMIFVDVHYREQSEDYDDMLNEPIPTAETIRFENAVYVDDETEEETEVPMECEEIKGEYDDTDINDWWPPRPW